MLLAEAPDDGWGPSGHAHNNKERARAARAQITRLEAQQPQQ